ncbi:MAG: DUF1549 domain-containing protein [Myxococcaceae bacterium]|nr:DUF1549 domain-containing protein [Myxococcaceae bacterium]
MLRLTLVAALCSSFAARAQAPQCAPPTPTNPAVDTKDRISHTRMLRRVTLALTGTTPTAEQYEALVAAPDDAAKEALISQAVDTALQSPKFYERMVKFGHEWLGIGAYTTGAQGDAYQGDMSGHLFTCGANTTHAGKLYGNWQQMVCNDAAAPTTMHEPWWAPGTMVSVVGTAGSNVRQVPTMNGMRDCGLAEGGYYDPALADGCGCGTNLVWCSPLSGLGGGSNHDLFRAQRRHPYEEPARLFAHLAWHDRPLSDLVTGNYSVGTNWLRALYVRQGRQQGSAVSDMNTTWWKPAADTSPRDPMHPTANDPQAWREFVVEDLNPFFRRSRDYQFDPRTTTQPPEGLPSAGVLTMIGSLSSFPRERVRAARFLETFACASFSPPPASVQFPPYVDDPAKGGTCMHCHQTLDPAAIFFKRWDFGAESYYVPWPFMGGVGRFRTTAAWLSGQYPHGPESAGPGYRWKVAFRPDTLMTPVTAAQVTANPEAVLLDTMPQSYTLLGEHGDGTMGPLGFGKILVKSGELDRCAARRLYAHFVGRDLDPAAEKLYIDKLAAELVAGDRKLRPFIKKLLMQPELRRGL